MTERTGSVVKEEINRVKEELNDLTSDRDLLYKEIEEEVEKGKEAVQKGLRAEGKSIKEEELEWDLQNTCAGIQVKKKELIELQQSGIVDKLKREAEKQLKWAEEFREEAIAKKEETERQLKLVREEENAHEGGEASSKNTRNHHSERVESIEYTLKTHKSNISFWSKEISVKKDRVKRLKKEKEIDNDKTRGKEV